MAIVYKITNKINGKSYIGQSVRALEQRWKAHLSSSRQGSKFRFHSAIRKYGVDNWDLVVLFEHEDVQICKKKEEELIAEFNLMDNSKGYNAKPGGCGGWVVFEKNFEKWKKNMSIVNTGLRNGNAIKMTNEELVEIGKQICLKCKRIISHNKMVEEFEKLGLKFPKSFREIRFGGNYKNYASILEKETGLKFDPYFRTEEHREKLSKANTGKAGNNKNTKVVIVEGKRKHVKN
jgi:group I intron endonuclease